MCPQWNQAMGMISMHLVDVLMSKEQIEPSNEKEEVVEADETPSVTYAINMFNCILISQKSIFDKKPLSDDPT